MKRRMHTWGQRACLALLAWACAAPSNAALSLPEAKPMSYWLNLGGSTWHSQAGMNAHNPAFGIEARMAVDRAIGLGVAYNSEQRWSPYLYEKQLPWSVRSPMGTVQLGGLYGLTGNYSANKGLPIPLVAAAAQVPLRDLIWSAIYIPRLGNLNRVDAVTVYLLVKLP